MDDITSTKEIKTRRARIKKAQDKRLRERAKAIAKEKKQAEDNEKETNGVYTCPIKIFFEPSEKPKMEIIAKEGNFGSMSAYVRDVMKAYTDGRKKRLKIIIQNPINTIVASLLRSATNNHNQLLHLLQILKFEAGAKINSQIEKRVITQLDDFDILIDILKREVEGFQDGSS